MKMEQKEPDKMLASERLVISNGKSSIVLAKKDGLVGEIEKTIFEMENQLAQAMKYEEEKQNIEFEREALMKEVERSLNDMQILVCHSKELEKQNQSMHEENISLKNEVEVLKCCGSSVVVGSNLNETCGNTTQSCTSVDSKNVEKEKSITESNVNGHDRMWVDSKIGELEKLKCENDELQKLLDLSEEAEDEAINELSKVKKELSSRKSEIANLEQEKVKLVSEKEKVSTDYSGLLSELDRMKAELEELMDAKTMSVDEVKQEEVKKLRETVQTVELENKKLTEQMENIKKENLRLQEKIVQLQVAVASGNKQQEKVECLEEKVKELQLVKENYERESGELVQKGVKATQLLKNSLEKLTIEKKDLQTKMEKMETEMVEDKECLKNERCEYAQMKQELEKLKSHIENMGKDGVVEYKHGGKFFPDIKGLNLEMKSELSGTNYDGYSETELKEECEKLFKKNQALTGLMGKLENENKDLDEENEELETQKQDLKERIIELEKGNAMELGNLATEKAELVNNLEVSTSENATLKHNQDSMQHLSAELQSKLLTTEKEKEKWKVKFEEEVKRSTEVLNGEKLKLTEKDDEIKLLKWRFQKESLEIKQSVNREGEERGKVTKERDEAVEKVLNLEKQYSDSMLAKEKLLEENERLEINFTNTEKQLSDTKERIEKLEKQIESFQSKAKESEATNAELRKSCAVANDLAMEKSLELSRTRRMLERKLEKLFKENIEMKKRMREFVPASSKPPTGKSKTDNPAKVISPMSMEPDVIQAVVTSVIDGSGETVSGGIGLKSERKGEPVKVVVSESQTLPRLRTNKNEEWKRHSMDSKRVLSGGPPDNVEISGSQTLPRQRRSHHTDEEKLKRHSLDAQKLLSLAGDDIGYYDPRRHSEAAGGLGERREPGRERRPKSATDLTEYKETRSESGFSVVGYRKKAVKMEEHWV